jgi:2',3'-cyclic-nucleotide 2'-phosphodiesterase (5'-nucleotidase family)
MKTKKILQRTGQFINLKNSLAGLALVLLLFSVSCSDTHETPDTIVHFTILQTSDVHHHGSGYGPFMDYTPLDTTDDDIVLGGYARLATVIKNVNAEQAAQGNPVLLFDSGDFLMGTVYDFSSGADPLAFKFYQLMGYDAMALGNHEFDWSAQGLAMIINNAVSSQVGMPFGVPLLATNMVTDPNDPRDDGLEAFVQAGVIRQSKVITLPFGLKIGVIGIMGPNADSVAPLAAPVTFNHDYSFIQSQVDELRNAQGCDLIVALSHTGIHSDGSGEDHDLAENVTGIDIIASGHTHTVTPHEYIAGNSNSIIFSPGEYGEWISRLDVTYNITQGTMDDYHFQLIPIDDSIPGDPAIQGMVDQYNANLDAQLGAMGLALKAPVTRISNNLEGAYLQETGLGNLAADANRTIATLAVLQSANPTPFSFGITPSGVLRDALYTGKTGLVTFSDAFNVVPLGITPDTTQTMPIGYPLMSIYLNAMEIRNVCEVPISISPLAGGDTFLNLSGVRIGYMPENPMGQRVVSVKLCGNAIPEAYGGDGDMFCLSCNNALDFSDQDTLYRCTVDLYTLLLIGVATDFGLTIVPKGPTGTPIDLTNPMDYMGYRIDSNPATADVVEELKEWMAFLGYVNTFFPATSDGVPDAIYGQSGLGLNRMTAIQTKK